MVFMVRPMDMAVIQAHTGLMRPHHVQIMQAGHALIHQVVVSKAAVLQI